MAISMHATFVEFAFALHQEGVWAEGLQSSPVFGKLESCLRVTDGEPVEDSTCCNVLYTAQSCYSSVVCRTLLLSMTENKALLELIAFAIAPSNSLSHS